MAMNNPKQLHTESPESFSAEYPVSVAFMNLMNSIHAIQWHWHEELEIIIVNSGALEISYDDKKVHLDAGEGVLFNQNVMHFLKPDDEKRCSIYSIKFSPEFLFSYDQPFMRSKYMTPVLVSSALNVILLNESNEWGDNVLDFASEIIAANVSKKVGYELISKTYLYKIWILLLQKNISEEDHNVIKTESLDEERIKSAITYIKSHYSEQLTLENISTNLHISKSECCRCFKRILHLSPFEYLMKYRIQMATQAIIENPNLKSISDLAFSVGFNNTSYFNKIFKSNIGCTPREYKHNVQKDRQSGAPSAAYVPYKF